MLKTELSPSQQVALERLKYDRNSFLTGAPGTGKSFLIREYLKRQRGDVPVLASTGAAAILVGGRTFHSFFGLGIMQGGIQATFERAIQNKRLIRRLKKAEQIIIDEVSMLSHDCFDCAEQVARMARNSDEPWGGIKVIAVGDFAQLPPVSRSSSRPWAFLGEAWAASGFQNVVLREVMRTQDEEFLAHLHAIRAGSITKDVAKFLDSKVIEEVDVEAPHIFPRRAQVERFNEYRLKEIDGDLYELETKYRGQDRHIESLMKQAPIPPTIRLKLGALVMLRMNDPKQRFVNGSLATVKSVSDTTLVVDLGHREVEIEKFSFTIMDADGEDVASATNFPISLAYANTIHKMQGTTLERAHIDLGNLWEPGQAYVALSRVKSADALSLSGWSERSFQSDPMVQDFYSRTYSV
jgi:ATP-dependent exoDNAse (exonuclease V) alpha subunit